MGSNVESLKLAFSTNTNWAEWGTLAVFVGLLGDIAVIVIFDLFAKNKSRWEIFLAGIASLVIAAGVLGESYFGHLATDAASRIQAVLEKQTADANGRAKEAEARIAEANQTLARLNNETAKLEAIAAGRNLKPEEISALAKSLKRFAGATILVGSHTGDTEGARLAMQIQTALDLAHIEVANRIGNIGAQPGGVFLGVGVSGELPERDMILAISNALASEAHLYVRPPQLLLPLPVSSGKLHPLSIEIGMRPFSTQ